jgi:hypothetical protein
MAKHLAPPNYFRIMLLVGVSLLLAGLGLLVSHVSGRSVYLAAYVGLALVLIGGAGRLFFEPRR